MAGEKKRLLEKSSPSDLIAMNDSAAALSRGSFAGSRGALESALANARVYRWDRKPDRNDYRPRSGVVDVRFDV